MLETRDLRLDKARLSDWQAMYQNVWSHPESAQYMLWNVTTNEADAKIRMEKTIAFQGCHDTYLVYEKATGQAIGFAGVERVSDAVYQEAGICLGPEFVGKGYGKQILARLIGYCRDELGAEEFLYSTRADNLASKALADHFGFRLFAMEERIDERNGRPYTLEQYKITLSQIASASWTPA